MPRLRRVRIDSPGWTRTRAGDGFVVLDGQGARVTDPEELDRISSLAIPPAWQDVWICPYPSGHIQAAGVDAAGRRQYLYHAQWRVRRDRLKHDHVLDVARRLPEARKQVRVDLDQAGWPRSKALALAFRLLDLAYFRAGNETYARTNGSYGLATLLREHVQVRGDKSVRFLYPAKSGQVRDVVVDDPEVARLVTSLRRRTGGGQELLAWRDGRTWYDVTSAGRHRLRQDRPGRRRDAEGLPHVARRPSSPPAAWPRPAPPPRSDRARRKVVTEVVRDVADALGNTPAVCRASYIDARLVDLWERGRDHRADPLARAAERAVLDLLG